MVRPAGKNQGGEAKQVTCASGDAENPLREVVYLDRGDDSFTVFLGMSDQTLYGLGLNVAVVVQQHDVLRPTVNGSPDPEVGSPCPPQCGFSQNMYDLGILGRS